MIIYKATNRINKKCYVGQTISTLSKRRSKHIYTANRIATTYFHKALIFNGVDNFDWEILDECEDIDTLNNLEIYYIKEYNSFGDGYNLNEGGGSSYGFKHSLETKKILSEQRKGKIGKKHTEEHKKYISEVMKNQNKFFGEDNHFYGKKHTDDAKRKMSEKRKGKKLTDEHKKKINPKGRVLSDETKEKIRLSNIEAWKLRRIKKQELITTTNKHI